MKNFLVLALLHVVGVPLVADSWIPPRPQTISSPEGKYLLRSIPPQLLDPKSKKWSKMLIIVYALDEATQDYREKSRFNVEGHPAEFLINDAGTRIVTMDQYYGRGIGSRVVAVYNLEGKELKNWALKDFYDKKKISKLPVSPGLPGSPGSISWRANAGWMYDQKEVWITKPTLTYARGNDELDDYFLNLRRLEIKKGPKPE